MQQRRSKVRRRKRRRKEGRHILHAYAFDPQNFAYVNPTDSPARLGLVMHQRNTRSHALVTTSATRSIVGSKARSTP